MRSNSASARSRGILVIRPTSPGIVSRRFLRSFPGRLDCAAVPMFAKFAKPACNGLRDALYQSVMEPHAERHFAKACQRNEVARNVDPLKSISLFEIAKTVSLLLPIGVIRVNQVRDSPVGARPHRLCQERIGWGLILLLHLRQDVHESCLH